MPHSPKDLFIQECLDLGLYHVTPAGEIVSMLSGSPRVLKQGVMSRGYARVGLSKKGEVVYVYAHRMVAIALIPNPLGLPQVNHIDAVKTHNHPSNLEWVTALRNSQHAHAAGLVHNARGTALPHAKLTDADVAEVRRRYAAGGITQAALGAMYGVKQNTISMIVTRSNWK